MTSETETPVATPERKKWSWRKRILWITVAAAIFAIVTMPRDLPDIPQMAIDFTLEEIESDPLVRDATILVEKDQVVLAVVVNWATSEDYGKQLGDRFVRRLASNASVWSDGDERLHGSLTKDYLGPLWDHYDLQVIVAFDPDNVLVQGAKVKTARGITW